MKAGDDRTVALEQYRRGHREEVTRRQRNFFIEDAADNAVHAARCVACQGVRSHAVPVALVGECSIPVYTTRDADAGTLAEPLGVLRARWNSPHGRTALSWNIAAHRALFERAHLVKANLHALWLRGLRAPLSLRYGVGIVAALVPSLLRIAMNPYWGLRFPYVFYFPATLFTALFSGLGPAWVGISICAAVTAVWILPTGSLDVSNPIDLVGLAAFIAADGIIAWIGASYRDLIEQSEHQNAELAARKHEAEEANRAKDDFLVVLNHELRTPLTTIIAGVSLLRQMQPGRESSQRLRCYRTPNGSSDEVGR